MRTNTQKGYRFKTAPAYAQVLISNRLRARPSDIYEYSKSFRSVYSSSIPLSRRFSVDAGFAIPISESKQVQGILQALATQIALANELLLKAILLGSTGKFCHEHSLKKLVYNLDKRYINIIQNHLTKNGLKTDRWDKVLDISADTFISARYGFEIKNYKLDFITLQRLNEALDDIYTFYLPDWSLFTAEQQNDERFLMEQVSLIFNNTSEKSK